MKKSHNMNIFFLLLINAAYHHRCIERIHQLPIKQSWTNTIWQCMANLHSV